MKTTKKLLTLALSAVLALGAFALASCDGGKEPENPVDPNPPVNPVEPDDPGTDFSSYTKEQFLAEDFSSKTISYQLYGVWDELPDYQMGYGILYNLYEDGSLKVDQVNIYSGGVYSYYGFWEESNGSYGHEIDADTLYMTDLEGGLMAKAISNVFYEEDNGTYSDTFNFDLAPGMYTRSCSISGGSTVAYRSIDEYYEATKKVVALTTYTSTEANAMGMNGQIVLNSDGTMVASLIMEYGGAPTAVWNAPGTYTTNYNAEMTAIASYTLTFQHSSDAEATVIEVDATAESFVWAGNYSLMGNAVSVEFTMVQ